MSPGGVLWGCVRDGPANDGPSRTEAVSFTDLHDLGEWAGFPSLE